MPDGGLTVGSFPQSSEILTSTGPMQISISKFIAQEKGSAALEYSLVAAAVAIGVLSAISALGNAVGEIYQILLSGLAVIDSFLNT